MCDKIVNAANSVSTNVINTIPRNTTSNVMMRKEEFYGAKKSIKI